MEKEKSSPANQTRSKIEALGDPLDAILNGAGAITVLGAKTGGTTLRYTLRAIASGIHSLLGPK